LIVDDELAMARATERVLIKAGFEFPIRTQPLRTCIGNWLIPF